MSIITPLNTPILSESEFDNEFDLVIYSAKTIDIDKKNQKVGINQKCIICETKEKCIIKKDKVIKKLRKDITKLNKKDKKIKYILCGAFVGSILIFLKKKSNKN